MKNKIIYFLALALVLAFAGIMFSQQPQGKKMSDYTQEWQQVDDFSQKGLPQSALEIVNKIYEDAKTSGNAGQLVKALIHRMRFQSSFEEDATAKNIAELEAQLADSEFPVTPVLQSALAELYWSYYQQHRYAILNRTKISGDAPADVRVWDAEKFVERTIELYQASLSDSDQLKTLSPDIYAPIIAKEDGSRDLRPTMYDLLAHRAADFFMNDETYLTRPAYQFHLRGEAPFLPAAEFAAAQFATEDAHSFKFYALEILQDLTAFHLDDEMPDALIDVDLKRLRFVHQHIIDPEKDDRYRDALAALEKKYIDWPASAWISYDLANFYLQQGSKYIPGQKDSPESDAHKWDRKKAYEICEAAVKRHSTAQGAKNCQALMNQIDSKRLAIQIEKINIPDQPFRALIQYQNLKDVYLRAIKVTPEGIKEAEGNQRFNRDQWIAYYRKQTAVSEWQVSLPDDGDFHDHAVEIKMPKLELGKYIFLVGTSKDFSRKGNAATIAETWISNLGFVQKPADETGSGVYVFHRDAGNPLSGVSAQIYSPQFNSVKRINEDVKGDSYTSDENGYFEIKNVAQTAGRRANYKIDFRYKNDRLYLDDIFYTYNRFNRGARDFTQVRTMFFTDRSIYRPGQTVYFKGLTLSTAEGNNEIIRDQKTTVTFFDVNRQKISEQTFVTNDYGTFSGTFTVPSTGLTGIMEIRNEYGSMSISVEEYKRPRFEVTFAPVSGSFRLNDAVKVSGTAKAYSGANIDNAQVQYRVVRQAIFPIWGFWRRPFPASDAMEITNGVSQTNADGEFEIRFTAIPDPTISKESQPTFQYTVYADVTDIGGETRSSTATVSVGYIALSADMEIPETMNREDSLTCKIISENLNGEFEAATGKIIVHELKNPGRIFRERFWQKPDQFLMTKSEYYDAFPHDIYDDEDDFRNWEKGAKVYDLDFDTEKSTTFQFDGMNKWRQGKYIAELQTKDAFGADVKTVRFFTIYSLKDKKVPDNAIAWHAAVKDNGEPGETAQFSWGSAAKDVHAYLEIYRDGKFGESRWIKTGEKKNDLSLAIREEDRGNFGYSIFFVKYGRTHKISGVVEVPWSNKDLKISYETFRDKLKPGQQEEWRIKLSGPKGDAAAAEMVAAMYDASLDAFKPHNWYFNIYNVRHFPGRGSLIDNAAFSARNYGASGNNWNQRVQFNRRGYDRLDLTVGYSHGYGGRQLQRAFSTSKSAPGIQTAMPMAEGAAPVMADGIAENADQSQISELAGGAGDQDKGVPPAAPAEPEDSFDDINVRQNLNETAFFFPDLQTNAEGEIILSFTMPEALTRWKMLSFSHTTGLEYVLSEKTVVTQKELMVVPNAPRFFREGDKITFSGKVTNLTEEAVSGTAILQLFDALSMAPLDAELANSENTVSFSADAGQSAALRWELDIPEGAAQALTYRIIAKTDQFSDGEESTLPVLTNRMLVTESLPLPIRGPQTKSFTFEKLVNSGKSSTLRHQNVALEYTSNPAWYAVQALPYLMEYPHDCSEQVFSRYYANSIAAHIANSNPKIKRVFDTWKNSDPEALLSNLEKNQELKSLLLEETPWVLEAQDESERKKRIALLFDLNTMSHGLQNALRKLQQLQSPNGAWPWFPEMRDSRYITTYIVSGFGHLNFLGIEDLKENGTAWQVIKNALLYLDEEMHKDYRKLIEKERDLEKQHIGNLHIQYLYARSFFLGIPVGQDQQEAFDYWTSQAAEFWLQQNKYLQGMTALALHRGGDSKVPTDIIKSLREHALHSEELGMYWRDSGGGFYWYQAPIETQALMIELFEEVAQDGDAVNDLKVWLLKQKQTQDWKTTRATADACYALLRRGTDFLASDQLVEISIAGETLDPAAMADTKVEAGTGYFKTSWQGEDITPALGNITVKKEDDGVAWGALYWQYFEQLDKITFHETPLSLKKSLFLEENSATGPQLTVITDETTLKAGDLVKVRIELRVDRRMEYVHMKDMRAAAFEPLNVISRHQYQGGLGYYESTRDASTNFFFDVLPKGTYVFEYPLRVTHDGDFSNGITTIQCMYAPEFTSHSEGIRVQVGAP